jgi:cyclohexa-1,5-dienecarbonyl-CoA hydratase
VTTPVAVRFDEAHTRAAFTLFHPKGNIVTAEMVTALRTALDGLGEDPRLKLITIEGAGRDFSYGASIPEHAPDRIGAVLPDFHRLIDDLLNAPAATAAVVRGRCLGGGFEVALACDFIFAAEDAEFGLPEIALGVFPPVASAILPARVGAARATRAILTGESRPADEWREAGLIELLAPSGALESEVDAWFARHLSPRSASAIRYAAAAARHGLVSHVRAVLPVLERLYLDDLMRTADAAEGISAFLQKRPPRWNGA